LSYHRACEAAPLSGAASVTVCTNDLALCNLVEDALPIAVLNSLRNAKLLVPEMVELKHDRIGLSAIDARVLAQIDDEEFEALDDQSPLSDSCLLDVPLTIGLVVLLLVRGAARPAVVVALPPSLPPPSEIVQRLFPRTAPASPHGRAAYGYEQTFARGDPLDARPGPIQALTPSRRR
jgi:hypothetical protein